MRKAFAQRITKHLELSEDEVEKLLKFPLNLTLYCLTYAGRWYRDRSLPSREALMDLLYRTIENKFNDERSKGFHKGWKLRDTTPKVTPKQIAKVKITTDGLRQTFQDCCTQCGDWTLSEADVEELLKRCSAETLHDIFKSLGRFDSDEQSQQRCFDGLEEAINHTVWQARGAA